MADPTINFTQKQVDPSLSDLLALQAKQTMLNLNCHAIAIVRSFDSENQTLEASIAYKKSYLRKDANGIYQTVYLDYPLLLDVPTIILGGGGAHLTFPIQAGDECLILFNDRDLDNWFQSGQITPVSSSRLHSFSDAIALVGLHSQNNLIEDYDTTRAVLRYNDALVGVGNASKVKIANNLETLNGLLQDLLTQLQALTVICAAPGNPSTVPVNAAAFALIATRIGSLLE